MFEIKNVLTNDYLSSKEQNSHKTVLHISKVHIIELVIAQRIYSFLTSCTLCVQSYPCCTLSSCVCMCICMFVCRNYSANLVSYSAGTLVSIIITNLTSGTNYTFACYAGSVVGVGEESDQAVFMTSK